LLFCKHSQLKPNINRTRFEITKININNNNTALLSEKRVQIQVEFALEDKKRLGQYILLCDVSKTLSAYIEMPLCVVPRPLLEAVSVVSKESQGPKTTAPLLDRSTPCRGKLVLLRMRLQLFHGNIAKVERCTALPTRLQWRDNADLLRDVYRQSIPD
jgi:hypothetical protein